MYSYKTLMWVNKSGLFQDSIKPGVLGIFNSHQYYRLSPILSSFSSSFSPIVTEIHI